MAIARRIVAALLARGRLRVRTREGQRRTHSPDPWLYGQGYAFGETDLNFGRAAP